MTRDNGAFDAEVARLMTASAVPGLALAVLRDGEIARVAAYGVRDMARGEKIDPRTVFKAASLSKPVFAHAVLQLADMNELSLDEPLSLHLKDHVPGDPRSAEITARHVLSHTSGLPNWRSDKWPLKTYFAPGERFSYSGEGFAYLQKVVERLTGESLDALVRRLVFAPLGMPDSSYVWRERFEANHAAPHDAALSPGIKQRPAAANAAYSLHTTAADFARFLRATIRGDRLRAPTARLAFEPNANVPDGRYECLDADGPVELDRHVAWGLGWGLELEPETFFHWGANDGFTAYAVGSGVAGTGLVAFTNGDNGLAIVPDIVKAIIPGDRPSLAWLGYQAT